MSLHSDRLLLIFGDGSTPLQLLFIDGLDGVRNENVVDDDFAPNLLRCCCWSSWYWIWLSTYDGGGVIRVDFDAERLVDCADCREPIGTDDVGIVVTRDSDDDDDDVDDVHDDNNVDCELGSGANWFAHEFVDDCLQLAWLWCCWLLFSFDFALIRIKNFASGLCFDLLFIVVELVEPREWFEWCVDDESDGVKWYGTSRADLFGGGRI